jgi:thiol-disulfide isomerase/thioredoxin
MPAIEEVHSELDGDVTVVGVDVTDTEAAGKEMVASTGVTYRNARDPRSEIFAVFGGIALPRTVLIDGDGTIVATHSGELDADELRALLDENGLLPA